MKRKPNTESDKQKEVTAASFKRIAKAIRANMRSDMRFALTANRSGMTDKGNLYSFRAGALRDVATALDAEAATLRAMR